MTFKPYDGLALYLRNYDQKTHGTAKQLMKKMRDHGAQWVAIAGPWDDERGLRFINSPDTCKQLAEAAHWAGLEPFTWGYPWQGREEAFADAIIRCSPDQLVLLDPELGANPTRSSTGPGKAKADAHAKKLVKLMADRMPVGTLGVSTFGSGAAMKWFPLNAFTSSLASEFGDRSFIGGQTYVDNQAVDVSIAQFLTVLRKYGQESVDLVPNFGAYMRDATGKARPKTKAELDLHFMQFIDEGEPIDGMIGWAENFMTPELWRSFAQMADRMDRGATTLPVTHTVPVLR